MKPKRWLNVLVEVLIVVGMLGGAALAVYLVTLIPQVAAAWAENGRPPQGAFVTGGLAILFLVGGEYIGANLFCMMRSLGKDPFVMRNVLLLRRMGTAALCITACGLLTLAFGGVPLAVVSSLPIGMCGLFSLVLSNVFETAVLAKQENDLTV